MIKNIIFDWSGVIKDANESHIWVVNEMIRKLGGERKLALNELRDIWEQPYMVFWNKIFPNLAIEEEQKIYKEIIMNPDCPSSRAYAGIVETINKAREKGMRMAVLSSDLPDTIYQEIKDFELKEIFCDVAVNVHDKKDEIINLIKRNNFNPKETVSIGDTNLEIEAGKLAGVKTIGVTWGFYSEERLASLKPDYIVHNIKELEEVLLS